MLHSQLENEISIYNKLINEGRKGIISHLLLSRQKKEIIILEDKIHEQTLRKESIKHKYPSRFIQYVWQIVYRFRNDKNRRNYSISAIPASATLQTQAGT